MHPFWHDSYVFDICSGWSMLSVPIGYLTSIEVVDWYVLFVVSGRLAWHCHTAE